MPISTCTRIRIRLDIHRRPRDRPPSAVPAASDELRGETRWSMDGRTSSCLRYDRCIQQLRTVRQRGHLLYLQAPGRRPLKSQNAVHGSPGWTGSSMTQYLIAS